MDLLLEELLSCLKLRGFKALQVGDGPDELLDGEWLQVELVDDLPDRLLIGECDILNCLGAA